MSALAFAILIVPALDWRISRGPDGKLSTWETASKWSSIAVMALIVACAVYGGAS